MSNIFHRTQLATDMADKILYVPPGSASSSGLFLAAPRRTGKSTFLREDLRPQLEAKGALVLYADLWENRKADPGAVIIAAVRAELAKHEGVVTRLARASGMDKVSVGGLSFALDRIGLGAGDNNGISLSSAFAALSDETGQIIVLIIDEAQHAISTDNGNDTLFALKAARDELNSSRHKGLRVVATRKRYALLQTPEFVEEFILDRTLTPAIREFGFREVRMIDPTCGSGHFLLGGFQRLVEEWSSAEPGRNRRDVAQKALEAVAGVDLNPFAVAISRFRLLVAALQVSDVHRLSEVPDFQVSVAIGDSLLHGKRFGMKGTEDMFQRGEDFVGTGLAHAYASEDLAEVQRILGRQYHAVVGNPPYIIVRDAALNAAYRKQYASCHKKYSLGASFTERFFELAVTGHDEARGGKEAGFVGLITANSFMTREFGSKLIEMVLPRLDLTHVVDTSGAYIPGHGTPTVILFGRHRAPVGDAVRTVMGIKGEPSTPGDPAYGLVWSAIRAQIDLIGSESDYLSVADTNRSVFGKHPWSISGGGASNLLDLLNDRATGTLGEITAAIGRTTHTGEDNVFFVPPGWHSRIGLENHVVPLVEGEGVRDFFVGSDTYEFTSTKIAQFPLVDNRPVDIASYLDRQARQIAAALPSSILLPVDIQALPTRADLDIAYANLEKMRQLSIAHQEELDWCCYRLYGLLPTDADALETEHSVLPEVTFGVRAFEIVLARRMADGTEQTTWFARHRSTPITEIPAHWPEDYRRVVQHRIDLIASDRNIALIERPEYKRRWNSPQWEALEQAALRDWLLARLESPSYWTTSADQPPQLTSTSRLADAAQKDADFMQMAALYAGHADFDASQLVADLVLSEAAPFLPVLRYSETGLRKRAQWEATWALQRREDAGEDLTRSVGKIPVPPKYQNKDFLKTDVWRLRGGLDVPKERWISYPGCERGADGSLIIAWAGWNHLQQATALAGFYLDMKENEGWPPERLQPLLAGLLELVPWLEQWHNDIDPVYGERMGHYYKGFVAEEARALGFTLDDLRGWKPAVNPVKRAKRTKT